MKKVLFLLSLLPLFALGQSLSSPDGKYTINMDGMNYTITYNNKVIVERSQLGVDIDNRLFESALAVPRGENENWCSDLELKGEMGLRADFKSAGYRSKSIALLIISREGIYKMRTWLEISHDRSFGGSIFSIILQNS